MIYDLLGYEDPIQFLNDSNVVHRSFIRKKHSISGNLTNFIVNGTEATPGQFPALVKKITKKLYNTVYF